MNNKLLYIFLIVLLPTTVLMDGCANGTTNTGISQGEIEYEVSYPSADSQNPFANILPSKMTFTFKDDQTVTEMKSGMGAMRSIFIANPKKGELKAMLKIFDDKMAVILNQAQIKENYAHIPAMTFTEVKGKKMIAGYDCKKIKVSFAGDVKSDITIYYTDDINIDQPNWGIPYSEIKGVLMEYEMEQNDIVMKFRAMKVIERDVLPEEFDIPEGYKMVDKALMDKKTLEITETFNAFN